ncbi:retrovirus-related pol polyprotein from transposon TNT 1-94, partial [Tanacetum coccineum]
DEKDSYNADIQATNIILQGLPKDIYSLINHYTDAKDIWDNVKMLLKGSELTKEDRESQLYDDFEHFRAAGYVGAQNRVGNANPGQARQVKCYKCNGVGHIARNYTQPKRPQNSEYFKHKMLLMQGQENGVVLDEEQLLFLAGG